jgi:hypothetical protein
MWVPAAEVAALMSSADYGLLLREQSFTNRVAAPTKFAEYLAAGLKIIISENLGDYSKLVLDLELGEICKLTDPAPKLCPTKPEERKRLIGIAERKFSKATHEASYRRALTSLVGNIGHLTGNAIELNGENR